MLPEEDRKAVQRVAYLVSGGHSETAQTMFETFFEKLARHHNRAGLPARQNWLKTMKAFSEVIASIAKMEA